MELDDFEGEIIRKVHDGKLFIWSYRAIKDNIAIIGFYFTNNFIPMVIPNGSIYYHMVIEWNNEIEEKK